MLRRCRSLLCIVYLTDVKIVFFLLGCCSCVQLVILRVFFGVTNVNTFWSVNKIVLTSLDGYF